ncbi:MAG TPA: hypothetical protein VFS64_06960 [Solirubrobacterales bacterium]|nr:hypothetical protein [Solirubrobacterales bacterium]
MANINEFINIPVPTQHVTKVYELIARLETGGPEADASPVDGREDGGLNQALVTRMYRESEDAHKRLLEFLADHPDEWLGSQAVADGLRLEHGRKSLAGSLGAFGRRADHRYGGRKPFVSRWDGETYQARLRMSQEVAAWVKAAAVS